MNWLSKFDALLVSFKEAAIAHWDVAIFFAIVAIIASYMIGRYDPARRLEMRGKIRQFRYCHDCVYNDLISETCAIYADQNDKCGLIDSTSGITWTIPTKT